MAVDGSDESLRTVSQVGALLNDDRDDVVLYTRPPEINLTTAHDSQRVAHTREMLAKAIVDEAGKRLSGKLVSSSIVGTHDPRRGSSSPPSNRRLS